jgi:hypothetical protein
VYLPKPLAHESSSARHIAGRGKTDLVSVSDTTREAQFQSPMFLFNPATTRCGDATISSVERLYANRTRVDGRPPGRASRVERDRNPEAATAKLRHGLQTGGGNTVNPASDAEVADQ